MAQYLAAYALVALNGTPDKKAVEAVLKAGNVSVDKAQLDAVFASFEGKDFKATVAEGKAKIGSGGGGGAAAAPAAGGAAPAAAAKPAAKQESSEDDGDMGSLF
jgi:large subunit ribosomal protein LP2